ncbi:MAG: type II toxin-antitoxin system RelE/ParE family toxin, partial [Novosphingobium sp.]
DLGGGVFKKRLSNNQLRSIILARGGNYWVYQFLFAKQDRANIDDEELAQFGMLAKRYAGMTPQQADAQVADSHWVEICREELEQGT